MKKTTKNNNKTSTNSNNDIEEYIKNAEISLANLEKVGALFLSIGYFSFFIGANLDILDILDINDTGRSPDKTFFEGQSVTVIGYSLLWIVAKNRVDVDILKKKYTGDSEGTLPHEKLAAAYSISIFANLLRLESFWYLYELSLKREESKNKNSDS